MSPPFTRRRLAHPDGDASLVVVPRPGSDGRYGNSYVDRFVPDEPPDGCWRATGVPPRQDGGLLATLEPGEGVFRTYHLLDHPDNPSCLPRGRYVGDKSFRVGDSRPEDRPDHPESEYDLELVVDVG